MPTSPNLSASPLALTDQQLDLLHRLSWPLARADRGPFLEAVAQALQGQATLGDGVIYRVCVEQQRRFWSPPLEREHLPSKWSR
jgi:hypothetical protein